MSSSSRIRSVQYIGFTDEYLVCYFSDSYRCYPSWRVPKTVQAFCCDANLVMSSKDYSLWEYDAKFFL